MIPDLAAFRASYCDIKLVKTRSVAQVILELPIEQAEAFIHAFGIPQPGKEVPVAIALLSATAAAATPPDAAKSERAKEVYRAKDAMEQAVVRASLLCKDPKFRTWLAFGNPDIYMLDLDMAADELRYRCGIKSRSEIASSERAYQAFLALETEFKEAANMIAERRG